MLTDLQRLARLHGVLPAYRDGFRQDRQVDDDALRCVLAALGADIDRTESLRSELRRARLAKWTQLVEPVSVSWEGRAPSLSVRLAAADSASDVDAVLRLEDGTSRRWRIAVAELSRPRLAVIDGRTYGCFRLPIGGTLPVGYHRISLRVSGRKAECLIIRAPVKCPDLRRTWGVFAPLHALHARESPGAGTFAGLGRLIEWVRELGGGLVGTLPLLATFMDTPFAPSPYTPVSRCFWNEFFIDLPGVPEWSPELGGLGEATSGRHVDYRRLMHAKRLALESSLGRIAGQRRQRFLEHLGRNPDLRSYAAFRASVEKGGAPGPRFDPADSACMYHAYAQWLADAQIAALADRARGESAGLYLDLPLGTHPLGFDAYRHADLFATGMAGGAPPDRFFSKGQNWGFAPVNPRAARASGHDYFIKCIRHHLRYAGVLRIDHLMGFHRLYWIPSGADGDKGAYVRYPADELYAIMCVEARRAGAAVVGEDLGTVPQYVRGRMAEHGIRRTYVAQFEVHPDRVPALSPPPCQAVASVNTHDTAMFATFWSGGDISDQEQLGLLSGEHAAQARSRRSLRRAALVDHLRSLRLLGEGRQDHEQVLAALLQALAQSDAECVMVTLEDLWGETEPQNTPGTDAERPNWTRKTRLALEQVQSDERVLQLLRSLDRVRSSASPAARESVLIQRCS